MKWRKQLDLRKDARQIIEAALEAVKPDQAVKKALSGIQLPEGHLILVAIGKAAWSMAKAACEVLGDRIDDGIVITKYGHVLSKIAGIKSFEAGHPVPDENSYKATEAVIDLVSGLTEKDCVLFLISGGGSALFESSILPPDEMADVTSQLLASGADIVDTNIIRKRLSRVKGGRFARLCAPARIESIVLSDIIGDPLDMIASGPAFPDSSTASDAEAVVRRYELKLSCRAQELLFEETVKSLANVTTRVTGSVTELCRAVKDQTEALGYESVILTESMVCQAKEAGSFLGSIARTHSGKGPKAFIAGGETVVELTGRGKGGRNQELALAAAEVIAGLEDVVVFSVGSDGTDGPTDAAGGIVDGMTKTHLEKFGIKIYEVLKENDSYHALEMTDGLIITGPTGTNVNDVAVVLIGK